MMNSSTDDSRNAVFGNVDDVRRIIAVVTFMAAQQTADALTHVWTDPFTWFDTGNCVVEGLSQAREHYRQQFNAIENLRTEILTIRAAADGDVGFAYSVQHFRADGANGGPAIDMTFRQTDCLLRSGDTWKVVHQHVSLPIDFTTGQAVMNAEPVTGR